MIEIEVKLETKVDLSECSQEALDSFGSLEAVKVDRYLIFRNCPGLTKLPDGLKVNGQLNLRWCTGLTKLPKDLKVRIHLDLYGCTGLTKLPDGLHVQGGVILYGCLGITKLPDDLHTGEKILYDSDTGFSGHEDEPGVIPERLKHKLKKWD